MVKSSMKLFKRSTPKAVHDHHDGGHEVEPSNHFAMLVVRNEHFGVDYCHDLSDLTYDQLQQVHSYIEFMQHYDNMSVADFELDDDDDEEIDLSEYDDDDDEQQ